jgi:hypothetical protein
MTIPPFVATLFGLALLAFVALFVAMNWTGRSRE